MLSLLFAAITATVWGTADFCGGKASQRAPALAVSVLSRLAGVPVLILGLILTGGTPTWPALGWGALAGAVGMVGMVLLYRGLGTGAMTTVAPVTAVTAALVPFLVGITLDGTPGVPAMIGVACAIGAIALVSSGSGADRKPVGTAVVGLALAAGTGIGLFMTLLSRADAAAGLWPLTTVQLANFAVGGLLLRRAGTPFRLTGTALRWAMLAGALDVGASVTYVFAAGDGALSVVAPIASLYPATTVLLALSVDREPVRPLQLSGLALAVAALILVAS